MHGHGDSALCTHSCGPDPGSAGLLQDASVFSSIHSMMYRWCLVAASFDRYALSSTNARLRNFATVRVARRVLIVLVPLWIVLPVHILIFYTLLGGNCGILSNYPAALYHSLFTTITGSVLPVFFMAAFSLLTYRNLVLKRQRRLQNANQHQGQEPEVQYVQRKRDQQVLLMLLIQVLVYVVLITPLMGFYFYSAVLLNIPNKTADRVGIEKFVQFVGETTVYTFPTSSFYLYTLVSQKFRQELVKLISFTVTCRWVNNNNRIGSITINNTQRRVTASHAINTRMSQTLPSNRDMSRRPTVANQQLNINQITTR